jgi:hypothetical protein
MAKKYVVEYLRSSCQRFELTVQAERDASGIVRLISGGGSG